MNLVQATAENFFNKGSQGYQIVPDSFFDHQGNICFLAWSVSDTKITGFENKFRVFKVLFNLENDADLPIEPLSEELTFDGLTKDKKEHQIRYDQEKSRLILIFLTKKDNINEHQQMNLNIQILNLNNYAFEMKNPYKAGTNFKFQQFGEFRPFGTHLIFRKYYDKLLGSYNYYKAIDLKSSNADTGWIRTKNWEKDFEPQYPCFYIDNEVCYTWNQTKEGENKVDYIMHERVNKNPEYGDRIPLLRTYIEFPFMTVLMPCRMRIYDLLVETFTDIIPP